MKMRTKSPLFSTLLMAAIMLLISGSVDAGLINCWNFDGTTGVEDSAGTFDLTLHGDASIVNDTERGDVLSLDGDGDYASNSDEPFLADTAHTITLWAKHSDSTPFTQRWISWGTGGARYFLGSDNYANSGRINIGIGSVKFNFTDGDASPLKDTWQHWALVRELSNDGDDSNDFVKLYVDGQLVDTKAAPATTSMSSTGELRIGVQYNDDEFMHGYMDDIQIWDEALTQAQIQGIMEVPEPSIVTLLACLALGFMALRRKK